MYTLFTMKFNIPSYSIEKKTLNFKLNLFKLDLFLVKLVVPVNRTR